MIKLLKTFTRLDWGLAVLLLGVVVAQVYFDVTQPDYLAKLTYFLTDPAANPTYKDILREGGFMLLYCVGSVVCTIIGGFIAAFIAANHSKNLRRAVFYKVNSFSFEEVNHFSTPSLITRSTNDIQQVQMTVMMFLRMAISAPITAIWSIIKINASSNTMMIAIALAVAFLIVSIIVLVFVVMKKFGLIQRLTDRLNGVSREGLTGLRVVKAYNAEEYQQKKFTKVNEELSKTYIFTNRAMGIAMPLMFLVMNALTLTTYWLGAHLINQGGFSIPELMKTTSLAMQVLFSFMMLIMLFVMLPRGEISARRISEVLDTESKIHDPAIEQSFTSEGTVEFKNVSFKYPDAEGYILHNINFKAEKGETVAFIGSTGSGKSTLINLVPRFYDATEGEVLVGGVNVKNVTQHTLRSILGYVPQRGVLFSGTVNDNISYGKEGLPEEKIRAAAVASCADEFVSAMEYGYSSHISQGAKNISGGQKQRLSIARAIAVEPKVYIFDDSFSALDYKTDREVRGRLKKLTKNATSLIVAARIGTIMDADKIIVLDAGNMVGMGTHSELMQNCEVYREIALSQLSEDELVKNDKSKNSAKKEGDSEENNSLKEDV